MREHGSDGCCSPVFGSERVDGGRGLESDFRRSSRKDSFTGLVDVDDDAGGCKTTVHACCRGFQLHAITMGSGVYLSGVMVRLKFRECASSSGTMVLGRSLKDDGSM